MDRAYVVGRRENADSIGNNGSLLTIPRYPSSVNQANYPRINLIY